MTTDKTTQTKLTPVQKREAVSLFHSGVETYTQIANSLGVPYKLVNTFMTKWKYKNGILKKRSPHKRQRQPKQVQKPVSQEVNYEYIPKIIREELTFLRDFYKATIDSVQAVILRNELHNHRNGTH